MSQSLSRIQVSKPEILEDLTREHLEHSGLAAGDFITASRQFADEGITIVTKFLPSQFVKAVGNEARVLLELKAIRRDFRMKATDGTPRRMHNVRRTDIKHWGTAIPALYECESLRRMLAQIAGEPLFICPFADEQYVITRLEHPGDTHGWHWDDYSFALVWVVEAPPVDCGGFVQCVSNTAWNKDAPRVAATLASNPTRSYSIGSGQVYLMRTDSTLHRVYPLMKRATRIVANMAWASARNLTATITHETVDELWEDCSSPQTARP